MKRVLLEDRPRIHPDPGGESRTKQSFKDACDINNIMAKFEKSGLVSHLAKGQPMYIDVSEVPDFRTALDHVRDVSKFFAGLPAELRHEFDNDPAAFMDGLNDPETVRYLNDWGIDPIKPEDAPEAPQEASGDPQADKDP